MGISTVYRMLKRLKITRKKNTVRHKKRHR
ncbi:MAG: hypothetical protein F6J98_46770 [Moorea sp. SIO4G2]|nr:hypothetical protein [Moorena sp. SIO4G2]